jgi:thiamine biosynthesis lipoprotein
MSSYESISFAAMGTEVELLAAPCLPRESAGKIRSLFESVEKRFSRFRPDSEISRANEHGGGPFEGSPLFMEVLQQALAAAEASDGLFDPTVLAQLEAAGYRGSFDSMSTDIQRLASIAAGPGYRALRFPGPGLVSIPPGVRLDLGGFVKGWAVDQAAQHMSPGANWCINAGGDMLVRGPGPEGLGWLVGVDDPFDIDQPPIAVLAVRDHAVATSSTLRRRWRTPDGMAHHLIDPRTGRSSETDLVSVTVVAENVALAEVLAKQILLLGSDAARGFIAGNGIASMVVDRSGLLESSPSMEEHRVD